jgi:spore coat protein U-like protein
VPGFRLDPERVFEQIWGDPNPNQYSRFWVWNESGTLPVYGLIPAGQDVPVGSYNDFVVATINF